MKPSGHVLSWLVFSIALMVQIWIQSTFTGLLTLLFILVLTSMILGQGFTMIAQLRWMFGFVLIFSCIQLLIRQDGTNELWAGNWILTVPGFEFHIHFRLTVEALTDTAKSVLRFILFPFVFFVITPLLSAKRLLSYGSRWFPNGAQMLYLTLRLVPFLKERSLKLQNILETRGFQPDQKRHWREVIRTRLPFLEALLEETLEGAWHRAESMVARGYGRSRRTQYHKEQWSFLDCFVFFLISVSFLWHDQPYILLLFLVPIFYFRFVFQHNNLPRGAPK